MTERFVPVKHGSAVGILDKEYGSVAWWILPGELGVSSSRVEISEGAVWTWVGNLNLDPQRRHTLNWTEKWEYAKWMK